MEKVENKIIENENLFRALVSLAPAVLFIMLALNSMMSAGIVLLQVIFILLALYFLLSALGHAALYTNERFDGKSEALFNNKNLAQTMMFLPLTILFTFITFLSITSSAHLVFTGISMLITMFSLLSTLAYAAYYTNDYYAKTTG